MGVALVRAPGRAAAPGQRKVTLRQASLLLTVPCTSPEVIHSDLTWDWATIARPGQRPLLRQVAPKLKQMQMTLTFGTGYRGGSVEYGLSLLRQMAGLPWGVIVGGYGALEQGLWRITDATIRSQRREPVTNRITRAEVTVTFTEAHNDGYQRPAATKKPPAKHTTTHRKTRYYTVRRGDTLSGIAARFYGHADRWPEIAKANHIRNPRSLQVGRRLVVPW